MLLAFSGTAGAAGMNTSAKCVNGATCDIVTDNELQVQNRVSGDVDLSFHDYADTADDDMQHAVITTNCTTTTTGAEDCDFSIGVVEGGSAADTRFSIDADGGVTVGSSANNLFTVTTDGTGDGEVVLPENSIGADEFAGMVDKIVLCGQDANSGTVYGGPTAAAYLGGGGEFVMGATVCNALDDATEATADAPISAGFPAFKVTGMHCATSSDASNDQVFTLRSAAADLTPSVTCTVAGSGSATDCSTTTASTTDVASGATIAVKSVNTEDLSGQDFWCQVYFVVK